VVSIAEEARKRRGVKGFDIDSLPYSIKMYMNNQLLIPAKLVRSLGIRDVERAKITIKYKDQTATIEAKLLKTKYTDSRQFTIPKAVRESLGLRPGEEVTVLSIEPL